MLVFRKFKSEASAVRTTTGSLVALRGEPGARGPCPGDTLSFPSAPRGRSQTRAVARCLLQCFCHDSGSFNQVASADRVGRCAFSGLPVRLQAGAAAAPPVRSCEVVISSSCLSSVGAGRGDWLGRGWGAGGVRMCPHGCSAWVRSLSAESRQLTCC